MTLRLKDNYFQSFAGFQRGLLKVRWASKKPGIQRDKHQSQKVGLGFCSTEVHRVQRRVPLQHGFMGTSQKRFHYAPPPMHTHQKIKSQKKMSEHRMQTECMSLMSCGPVPLRLEVRISLSKQVDSLWENQMENWGFEENTKMWYLEAVCKLIFLNVYIITCLLPDSKYNTGTQP